jgi:stearoyl-CoA desaturase (delta-9 desaturase)
MININYTQIIFLILAYVHVGITVHSIYIHRSRCHGTIIIDQKLVKVFQLWLWLFGLLASRYRVASHYLHHKYSDTELDFNGPKVLGIFNILLAKPFMRFVEIFLAPFKKPKVIINKEIEQIVSKKLDLGFFYQYIAWGVWINLLMHIVLFGIHGVTIWIITMFLTRWVALAFGDGIIHLIGYRNFKTNDCSKNVMPLAILFGGEELHNNHHHRPQHAKFSVKWWEFDISWFYIRILATIGLIKILKK